MSSRPECTPTALKRSTSSTWWQATGHCSLRPEASRSRPLCRRRWDSLSLVFDTLSDRLATVFSNLRGKGRLSPADIDATAREIRIALLEADVALPVVRTFIAAIKERAASADVSGALNPAQQV